MNRLLLPLSAALLLLAGDALGQSWPRIGYAGLLVTNVSGATQYGAGGGGGSGLTFTNGLRLWFEADTGAYTDGGTNLATDGQTVQRWNDVRASATNASQSTADLRPVYKATAANGEPAILFDGTNDQLVTAALTMNIARTVFVVVSNTVTTKPFYIEQGTAYNDANGDSQFKGNASAWLFTPSGSGNFLYTTTASATWSGTAWTICELVYDGTNAPAVYRDGASVTTSANAGTPETGSATTAYSIGGRAGTDTLSTQGYFSAVLIFEGAVGSSDRTTVRDYLKAKYGTP